MNGIPSMTVDSIGNSMDKKYLSEPSKKKNRAEIAAIRNRNTMLKSSKTSP